jgi:hypothetical protein
MGRDETHDAGCRWAFRKTFRRSPTPDELRDYKLALDERDRLGLNDALPIFSRLRNEAGLARPEHRRKVAVTVVEPNASPAAPPPEPESPQTEPPVLAPDEKAEVENDHPPAHLAPNEAKVGAGRPAGNGRPRAPERAERCLRELLADGPRHGEHVIAAAAEVDVSERTLIAAAERLGVRSQRGQWRLFTRRGERPKLSPAAQ